MGSQRGQAGDEHLTTPRALPRRLSSSGQQGHKQDTATPMRGLGGLLLQRGSGCGGRLCAYSAHQVAGPVSADLQPGP
jgi:hypothetical protein